MQSPLINVLIRTSHRPGLFRKAVESIKNQTHQNTRIIVGFDSEQSLTYTRGFEAYLMDPGTNKEDHYWNLYCNQLKSRVNGGWFFYLDDDDYLYSTKSLENIAKYLTNPDEGVICQFLRNGRPKPAQLLMDQKRIEKGRIGAPCLFLHSSKKDIANWDGERAADYRWIRDVAAQIQMKFVNVVVVEAGNNGLHGR